MKRIFLALMAVAAAQPLAAQSIDTITIRSHTRFLASDLLEGRGTGTRGEQLASLYIASQLALIGARPATGSDYLIRVPLKRAIIDNANTSISYAGNAYTSVTDFVWNTGARGALRNFAGGLTWVGMADSAAVHRAGELKGRIAVMAGAMGAAAGAFVPALVRAGAAGIVLIVPDSSMYNLYVRSRGDSRYYVDADVDDPIWQADLPIVIAGPRLSRAIVNSSVPTQFTSLHGDFAATMRADVHDVSSANVAGVIRGTDPKLAQEHIAFSAHYDHLGISTPDSRGDSIYNGFSDNAAGVAMVLAIGEAFAKKRPARSILLLFFTGEERGLLGSSYYAANPAIPLAHMKALINLDGGAPSAPPIDWRIAGGDASPLGGITKTALATRKWDVQLSGASPNSDYWPFLKRGVNAVFIIPGNRWENTTADQQKNLRTRWDHYHQAADEWSADFPFSGLQRYAEAALTIGRFIANKR